MRSVRDQRLISRFRSALPPSRPARKLTLIAFIDAVGSGVFLGGSAVFFTQVVGLSPAQVGLGLSLAAVLGFVSTVPIGMAADHFGDRRALVVVHLWRASGFLAYAFARDLTAFLIVACLLGLADRVMSPLTQSLVTNVVEPPDRVRTMAFVRAVRNAGFAVGAGTATLILGLSNERGYVAIALANAISYATAAWMLITLRSLSSGKPSDNSDPRKSAVWLTIRSLLAAGDQGRRYLLLTVLSGVMMLHLTLITVAVPLWIVTETSLPAVVAGAVLWVNTALVVLFQVPTSRLGDTLPRSARAMGQAGLALAGGCVLIAWPGQLDPLAAGAVLLAATCALTLGELLHSVGAWSLSMALAPDNKKATYLSVFSLGETLQVVIGPILVTAWVLPGGGAGWVGLGAGLALFGWITARVADKMVEARPS